MSKQTPQQIWEIALGELQRDMPKAAFDTWVRDTQVVSFDGNVMAIGTRNDYARDWLTDRLSSTVSKILTGILNQPIDVQFVVAPTVEKSSEEEGPSFSADVSFASRYMSEVRPNRVVVIPGYALRLLEHGDLTAKEMSLWIGFRQAVYRQWEQGQKSIDKDIPFSDVTRFAMMSKASFFRELSGKKSYSGGLVELIASGNYEKTPNRYRVHMNPRLTRQDCAAIEKLLAHAAAKASTRADAHRLVLAALETLAKHDPASYLNQKVGLLDPVWPRSISEIVRRVLGIEDDIPFDLADAAEHLYDHIIAAFGKVLIPHYFLRNVVPTLGLTHPQAWAIIMLRDRSWFDYATKTQQNYVFVPSGIEGLAKWVGVTPKSVLGWLQKPEFTAFVQKPDIHSLEKSELGEVFVVNHLEPLTSELEVSMENMRRSLEEIRSALEEESSSEKSATPIQEKASRISGKSETRPGKSETRPGKSETRPGKSETRLPEKVRHDSGKSEPLIKLLKPLITSKKPLKPLKPPHPKNLGLNTRASALTPYTGVVVKNSSWNLATLLDHNRVSQKLREKLLQQQTNASAFVSWLLYCASQRGNTIRDPVSYALSRIQESPHRGAGAPFDDLARLEPCELAQLFAKTFAPDDRATDLNWEQAMRGADLHRLSVIASCLFDATP